MAQHKCPHCQKSFEVEIRFTKAPAQQSERSGDEEVSTSLIPVLLEQILESDLDDKAAEFVEQTRARWKKYGARIMMSGKQFRWLERIAKGEFRREEEAF